MPSTTRLFGIVLVLLGMAGYWGTGRTSVTALIPAFIGALFLVLALIARNEAARKHALHVAVLVALVGLIGTSVRLAPALLHGQIGRPAVLAQLTMFVLLAVYFALTIQSFVAARRARKV